MTRFTAGFAFQGLQYLHKSPIRYHGLLLTKHCLVDSNWVLKLTHFGVASMLHELIADKVLQIMPEHNLNPDCEHFFSGIKSLLSQKIQIEIAK